MKRWISLILFFALFSMYLTGCSNSDQNDWHAGVQGEKNPSISTATVPEDTMPTDESGDIDSVDSAIKDHNESVETKPEDVTEPTEVGLIVTQLTEDCYERLLAAGVLIGLSMNYPDFELEELCYKEETSLSDKMSSDGVYAFFQSGGESLCIHAAPLSGPRSEQGTCDLQETTLGYASFDRCYMSYSELEGYVSLMDQDLSQQINQLYLLTIIEN